MKDKYSLDEIFILYDFKPVAQGCPDLNPGYFLRIVKLHSSSF